MKLVTFSHKDKRTRLGAIAEGQTVDLNLAYCEMLARQGDTRPQAMADAIMPTDIIGFLDGGERTVAAARETLDFVAKLGHQGAEQAGLVHRAESVRMHAPVPRPRKLFLVGLNYRDHAEEAGAKIPEVPTFFSKASSCVVGPGAAIKLPKVSTQIDYEGEFALVIGKRAKDVPKNRALDCIAGYTIVNDVSCRDYQRRTGQWMIGKTFDTFAPMGPWLVTRDEIADPHNLELSLYLNGQRMQHSNTSNLIFKIPDLIEHISQVVTLEPGDMISTGTPAGVGFVRKPPVFLKAGDRVRIEIAGLGALENTVES